MADSVNVSIYSSTRCSSARGSDGVVLATDVEHGLARAWAHHVRRLRQHVHVEPAVHGRPHDAHALLASEFFRSSPSFATLLLLGESHGIELLRFIFVVDDYRF